MVSIYHRTLRLDHAGLEPGPLPFRRLADDVDRLLRLVTQPRLPLLLEGVVQELGQSESGPYHPPLDDHRTVEDAFLGELGPRDSIKRVPSF